MGNFRRHRSKNEAVSPFTLLQNATSSWDETGEAHMVDIRRFLTMRAAKLINRNVRAI